MKLFQIYLYHTFDKVAAHDYTFVYFCPDDDITSSVPGISYDTQKTCKYLDSALFNKVLT